MKLKRTLLVLALVLALIPNLFRPAAAATEVEIIRNILAYYYHYQEAAETDIARLLEQLEEVNSQSAQDWRYILDTWRWAAEDLEVNWDVLPDGLPQDDSLCIIVMGYQLTYWGEMEPELISRLEVALASAEKYPNAYILCAGGGTAPNNPYVTEAWQMAKWLEDQGIAPERIITESRSFSTEENAMYAYRILASNYPQVNSIALVSSHYHLRRCHLLFRAAQVLSEPDYHYAIVGDACFDAGYEGEYEGYEEETTNLGRMVNIRAVNLPKPTLSVLTGIQVSGITDCDFREALNLTVTAEYDSGYSREIVSGFSISGFDPGLSGEQEITISYVENGVTMEAGLTVTVAPPPTTEPPATEAETTAPPTLPAETVPIVQTEPATVSKTPILIIAGILAVLLLCLFFRPRRGKYEKRSKS